MALPFLLKIIFLVFAFACLGATVVSLYLPNWEAVSVNGTIQTRGLLQDCIQRPDLFKPEFDTGASVDVHNASGSAGSVANAASNSAHSVADAASNSAHSAYDAARNTADLCQSAFETSGIYVKIIVGLVAVSILLQLLAIAWAFVSFCYCCCSNLFAPIGGLTGLAGALNIISVAVFYSMSVEDFKHITDNLKGGLEDDSSQSFFNIHSFSLFIMIGSGVVLLVVCTALAVTVQKVDKREPEGGEGGKGSSAR
uniref:MARVEL domain-containing protein n=2 Tax=Bursaphelenchus xylophilus TaxID=6326 RepID=A0A1I7RQF9_BURXY